MIYMNIAFVFLKSFVKLSSCLTLLLSSAVSSANDELKGSKPNIIFVLTDDQGMGDLSLMGNKILKTPQIDAFSKKATRFTEFHVSPTCAPTRAALMSGTFPFHVGVTHTILQRERMALSVHTLPQMLKSAGYTTGLFGKWHLGDEAEYLPQKRGFDEVLMHGAGGIGQVSLGDFKENRNDAYFDNILLHNDKVVQTQGFCTDVFFEAAKAWIQQQEKAKKPYFAFLSLNAPHGPFFAPASNKKRFLDAGYGNKTAARYGMIENIDSNFGSLMKMLESTNALENTIVIFMTDNGMSMPPIKKKGEKQQIPFNAGMRGKKNSPYQGGTRVPSFWYWDKLKQDIEINALTAHIDIYKTFAEISGATLPATMQKLEGRSLLKLFKNADAPWDDRNLYVHCGRWNTGAREQFKYTKCAIRNTRWRLVNGSELYDITNDPSETTDVSTDHPEVVAKMKKDYDLWWERSLPLMINEGLPRQTEFHIQELAKKQKSDKGFPLYEINP